MKLSSELLQSALDKFRRPSPSRRRNRRLPGHFAGISAEILEDRMLLAAVGYYDMSEGAGVSDQVGPINAAGETAVQLSDLTSSDLAGIDVLFVQNPSNVSYGSEYLSRLESIEFAVSNGMTLIIHDRFVDLAESILPGGGDFNIVRDTSDGRNINVLNPDSLVADGPGGIVTNSTLDGGNSSSHGFAFEGSLPGSADLLLSTGDPTHIVTFSYQFGEGQVVYSSIPLDFYLASTGTGVAANMRNIYAPNIIAYGASFVNASPVVSDFTRTGTEDSPLVLDAADFANHFSDPDGDELAEVRIDSLPTNGALELNGIAVTAGQVIDAAELDNLVFVPNLNFNGQTSFTWSAGDGNAFSQVPATVTLDILSANQQVDLIAGRIDDLFAAGVINDGQAEALKMELKDNNGDTGKTGAFLNMVEGYIGGGILTEQEAEDLSLSGELLLHSLVTT